MSSNKHFFKIPLQKIRKPFKLTTRITMSNVIFFTLVIALITVFVFFLTQQFLFLKNRDELYVKRDQIDTYFADHEAALKETHPDERLERIYRDLQELYLFDHYKYIAFIYNTEDESSYAFEKNYYDRLFLSNFNIVTNDLTFSYAFENRADQAWMTFNISEPNGDGDSQKVATAFIPLPTKNDDSAINQISFLGDTILETTLMVSFDDGKPIYLTLFLFPQYDRAFILILLSALIVSSLIGILLIGIFGRYITRRALQPLVNVSSRAENIHFENIHDRIPQTGAEDELDSLIKSLNGMLDNLEDSFDNQRRFISDASHELRIPLTVILGYMDLLNKTNYQDEALMVESLQSVESEARGMQYLVEKLLLLARADSHRIPVSPSSFDLCRLFEQLKIDAEMLYGETVFEIFCSPELNVYADYDLLLQALRALIDNAIKYGNSERGITVSARLEANTIAITVRDYGAGIPADALQHLTERFYRVGIDRNRNTGGFGLGLSIVKALIDCQSGQLQIESTVGKGTAVLIMLPVD
ncbi:HAMP domain-containing protein [Fusibacter paucivorans]|uniref:histidine kinase n=1 Tax=Fusibacter paucivorans TaxID=76009 RepID=A0ABS5PNH2_9FIRM|nr:HAMP domain-containing sensor histidine kinase [Fusibacter paucivorans]MBS7526432.1 HAMP domain-containing protein [Fusibacter paucivorans]